MKKDDFKTKKDQKKIRKKRQTKKDTEIIHYSTYVR